MTEMIPNKIMVVEDNLQVIRVVQLSLKGQGYI